MTVGEFKRILEERSVPDGSELYFFRLEGLFPTQELSPRFYDQMGGPTPIFTLYFDEPDNLTKSERTAPLISFSDYQKDTLEKFNAYYNGNV